MSETKKADIIIVGGGIAGLTASAYLCKAGVSSLLLEQTDQVGGLVNSFPYKGFIFDGGIRSIESSGVIKPMIQDLGLEVEFLKTKVTLGIQHRVIALESKTDIPQYEALLCEFFPENKDDIHKIIRKVTQILKYMDVLYGIDNPMMMDLSKNKKYVFQTLLPWFFQFVPTLFQIDRLTTPVEPYLKKFTTNQALIDIMIQHFFQATPAFFALGYFSIYFDYHYPMGGTQAIPFAMKQYIEQHGGIIQTNTTVTSIDPIKKTLLDQHGNVYQYQRLIWAADLNQLYRNISLPALTQTKLSAKISKRRLELQGKTGAESVVSVYLTTTLSPEYFNNIASGHFFYTPVAKGIHDFSLPQAKAWDGYEDALLDFYQRTTYEISIPVLRDPALAPIGQSGLIISVLFPYHQIKQIAEFGHYEAFKDFTIKTIIQVLNHSIYPGLQDHLKDTFCSTPMTFEKRFGLTDGAIIGWSYTNHPMPVKHKMSQITSAFKTPIKHIYQAGQWSFSPAGIPISVLTGKLAADHAKKGLKKRSLLRGDNE